MARRVVSIACAAVSHWNHSLAQVHDVNSFKGANAHEAIHLLDIPACWCDAPWSILHLARVNEVARKTDLFHHPCRPKQEQNPKLAS